MQNLAVCIIVADRRGAVISASTGSGSRIVYSISDMIPRVPARAYARELIVRLRDEVAAERCKGIVIVACAEMMDALKNQLDPALREMLIGEIVQDSTIRVNICEPRNSRREFASC